ncbi:MAG: DUF1579 domain-containing protein [bacterium]
MRKILSTSLFAVLLAVSAAPAQDGHEGHGHEGHGHDMPAMDEAAMMEAWQKTMMPGPEHKEMEYFVGDWKLTSKSWMMGEGEPQVSTGTAHGEMFMGGRFLHSTTKSEMMGLPFEGLSLSGYDNVKKEHYNLWFDTMGTGVMYSTGNKDAEGNMVLTGTFPDPMMGNVAYTMKSKILGPDSYLFEMFMNGPGGEMNRVLEITYQRVKSS